MDKVYIGRVVGTHGIKGEIRIVSDFPYKEKVFVVGKYLWIDEKKYQIQSYRVHKHYDMVTLDDFRDINEVLFLLKKDVYFSREDLVLEDDEVLDEDLIQYEVLTNKGKRGIIKEIFKASAENKIMRVLFEREVLIPMNSPMIEKIDKEKKIVFVKLIDGME